MFYSRFCKFTQRHDKYWSEVHNDKAAKSHTAIHNSFTTPQPPPPPTPPPPRTPPPPHHQQDSTERHKNDKAAYRLLKQFTTDRYQHHQQHGSTELHDENAQLVDVGVGQRHVAISEARRRLLGVEPVRLYIHCMYHDNSRNDMIVGVVPQYFLINII